MGMKMGLNWLKPGLSSPNQGPEADFQRLPLLLGSGAQGPGGRASGAAVVAALGLGAPGALLFPSGDRASTVMDTRVLRRLTAREAATRLCLWPNAGSSGSLGRAPYSLQCFHIREPLCVGEGQWARPPGLWPRGWGSQALAWPGTHRGPRGGPQSPSMGSAPSLQDSPPLV